MTHGYPTHHASPLEDRSGARDLRDRESATMMDALVSIACGISIVAFAWHGAALIWTQTMAADFARYGLTRHRAIVGALHLVGSAGLLLGLWSRPILPLAAGGLALLMLIAIGFRMQVRDPLRTIVPAIAFCALNVFVVTATR